MTPAEGLSVTRSCCVLCVVCCVLSDVAQTARLEAAAAGDSALAAIEEVEGVVARCGRALEVSAAKDALAATKRIAAGETTTPRAKGKSR
jgi:transposase